MDTLDKRNNKLLQLERSYKNAYRGSLFLLIISIIAFASLFVLPEHSFNIDSINVLFLNLAVWATAYTYVKGKLDHIETIKRYRNENNQSN